MTHKEIIMKYVESQHPRKVPSWELQSHDTPFGFLGPSADREARALALENKLHREHIIVALRNGRNKHIAHYSLPEQLTLF
mgnify:CR=1 FL=1|tara:strand:- start:179 stop:421 length:243 start_codon:yes stop_codon:yes gene_type:complete